MVKAFCPEGHPTISSRFSVEELGGVGVQLVHAADDADIIIGALVEEMLPLMQLHGVSKKFLVWCDEPLWSNLFQRIDVSRTAFLIQQADGQCVHVPVDAMNGFTGNVFFCNHHFLLDTYHLDLESFLKSSQRPPQPLPARDARRIAAFLTYRNGGFWDFKHPSGIFGLNTLRSRIALEGALFGRVDVYGQGWPLGLAKPEDGADQEGIDPFDLKLRQYARYHFALCFENTWSPYYVTEKIWQAIIGGCLPIYYAGPAHTIYQDFPRSSFIDFADFENPSQLFDFVDKISQEEFDRRMSLCSSTLLSAIQLSGSGQRTRKLQLSMFSERVHAMTFRLHTS
jgi:hypothetical protein